MHSNLSSKGQITLPKALRDHLHLSRGDRVDFVIEEDGSVRLVPRHLPIQALKGMLPTPDRTVSLQAMDEAIEQAASDS